MSIDSERICCTGCDYETVEAHRPVIIVYVLADGKELQTGRGTGWCYVCDEYRDIENVDAEKLQLRLAAQEQEIKEIGSHLKDLSKGFLGRFRNTSMRNEKRLEIECLNEELRELSALLSFSKQRISRPRCLKCWSEHTAHVTFDEGGLSQDFMHKCGGVLRVVQRKSTLRISFRTTTYVLDIEGHLLAER